MPNYFIHPDSIQGHSAYFNSEESHHISRVKRHRVDDEICAVDGLGATYQITITKIREQQVTGVISEKKDGCGEPTIRLTLAQSMPKGRKLDWVIEKGTELGVAAFFPFISERSISRPIDVNSKVKRWEKIGLTAMKQCGRSVCPVVHPLCNFSELAAQFDRFDRKFFANPDTNSPLPVLDHTSQSILLIVGPEGGLTSSELDRIRQSNAESFSMGSRILRTETAGMVATALIMHETGNL